MTTAPSARRSALPARALPRRLAGLALAGLAAAAAAQNNFELDPEPIGPREHLDAKPWEEGRVDLPPWPRDADLVPWSPEDVDSPFRFFLDKRSIEMDPAGAVVRYTVVVESPSGTRNLSFEGIRCTLRGAYRVYAYGSDGRLVRAPENDWQPLSTLGSEAYRRDLWENRLCIPRELRPREAADIVAALTSRGPGRPAASFFAD